MGLLDNAWQRTVNTVKGAFNGATTDPINLRAAAQTAAPAAAPEAAAAAAVPEAAAATAASTAASAATKAPLDYRLAQGMGRLAGRAVQAGLRSAATAPLMGYGDYKVPDSIAPEDSSLTGTMEYLRQYRAPEAARSFAKGAVEAGLDSVSGLARSGDWVAGLAGYQPGLAKSWHDKVTKDLGMESYRGAAGNLRGVGIDGVDGPAPVDPSTNFSAPGQSGGPDLRGGPSAGAASAPVADPSAAPVTSAGGVAGGPAYPDANKLQPGPLRTAASAPANSYVDANSDQWKDFVASGDGTKNMSPGINLDYGNGNLVSMSRQPNGTLSFTGGQVPQSPEAQAAEASRASAAHQEIMGNYGRGLSSLRDLNTTKYDAQFKQEHGGYSPQEVEAMRARGGGSQAMDSLNSSLNDQIAKIRSDPRLGNAAKMHLIDQATQSHGQALQALTAQTGHQSQLAAAQIGANASMYGHDRSYDAAMGTEGLRAQAQIYGHQIDAQGRQRTLQWEQKKYGEEKNNETSKSFFEGLKLPQVPTADGKGLQDDAAGNAELQQFAKAYGTTPAGQALQEKLGRNQMNVAGAQHEVMQEFMKHRAVNEQSNAANFGTGPGTSEAPFNDADVREPSLAEAGDPTSGVKLRNFLRRGLPGESRMVYDKDGRRAVPMQSLKDLPGGYDITSRLKQK